MFYNIERTLEFFPSVCFIILGITLLFFEIRNIMDMLFDRPQAEPGRGGFIPPSGDGYEYYSSQSKICFILRKAKNRFRVYLVQGSIPNVPLKHDKYGQYFVVRCEDTATAEKIIDQAFQTSAT